MHSNQTSSSTIYSTPFFVVKLVGHREELVGLVPYQPLPYSYATASGFPCTIIEFQHHVSPICNSISFLYVVARCVYALTKVAPGTYTYNSYTEQLSFHADLAGHRFPFRHTWEECVGSGHASLGLRSDWQSQLLTVHNELGFK